MGALLDLALNAANDERTGSDDLRKAADCAATVGTSRDPFDFTPLGDPTNDDEALRERAAIIAEASGWNNARALQEARWQSDRERCWRTFLRHAGRVQAAPEAQREAILAAYEAGAIRRYGEATGAEMARSLASWVRARGVH
jgi:hypothetical protein